MTILFNDILQNSDAPKSLISPALSDIYEKPSGAFLGETEIHFGGVQKINCIGIGNTDAQELAFFFNYNDPESEPYYIVFNGNGLYKLPETVEASDLMFISDGTFTGRIAMGNGIKICTSIAKEPGLASTASPRLTLSGQVMPGRGGYTYRTLSLDSRYKLGAQAMAEIAAGYKYIGMGYPFFVNLEEESYKLWYDKLYAEERNQREMSFEGGIMQYLYSRRWEFEERF
ncbi:MAG: hypothetical protein LBG79_07770 [Spirochaetaceae bacterium]|jgi:hypothetical protein|nr:hypothetical protein [Spirochaetaceae bacterium]